MPGMNKGICSRCAERSRTGQWWEASTGGEWTGLRRSQMKTNSKRTSWEEKTLKSERETEIFAFSVTKEAHFLVDRVDLYCNFPNLTNLTYRDARVG